MSAQLLHVGILLVRLMPLLLRGLWNLGLSHLQIASPPILVAVGTDPFMVARRAPALVFSNHSVLVPCALSEIARLAYTGIKT